MAIRKPAPIQLNKKTGRPVAPPPRPLPVDRKTGRPIPPPRPPIDMVRDPRFDSAMANQDYENRLRAAYARLAAERGGAGAVIDRLPTLAAERGGAGAVIDRLPAAFAKLAAIDRRTDRITPNPEPKSPSQPRPSGPDFIDSRDPNFGYTMNMINYYDPATGEVTSRTKGVVPAPGSRFVRYSGRLPQGPNGEDLRYIPGYVPPQQGGQQDYGIDYIEGGQRYAPMTPTPPQMAQFLQGQQGAMASQYPSQQAPQASQGAQNAMATYNNLLQQGIQRRNTMNQDAASNFANMQAGAPTTQPASPAKANPVVPIAGMGMQQPKATPAPRKFSTVNTPSARFG